MASSQDVILFLGVTGAEKSSIIAKATGADVPIGQASEFCTKISEGWTFSSKNGRSVTLIDSPGLGQFETYAAAEYGKIATSPLMSDVEVLRSVTQYFEARPNLRVIAMVYLHPITRNTFDLQAQRILKTFQQLCGEHNFRNVVIVTTMWDVASESALSACGDREKDLCQSEHVWRDMITQGASYLRFDGTDQSSKDIVDTCLCKIEPKPALFISNLRNRVKSDSLSLLVLKLAEETAFYSEIFRRAAQEDGYSPEEVSLKAAT